jgi:antiviral helicase SKI2
MSGGLSLERLHQILVEEEEKSCHQEELKRAKAAETAAVQQHLDKIWQRHGMQAPFDGAWIRPLPSSLYKTPLSAPQTTLATWSSLPKPIQDKLTQLTVKPNAQGVVEVPLYALLPQEDGAAASLQQKPLGGNLTNKLTEYARGFSGQTKPFRAGGMDAVEEQQANPYHSPEAIQRAQKPLDQGTEASWKDGSLLTAPPGLDFEVGLDWTDVYKTKPAPKKDAMEEAPLQEAEPTRNEVPPEAVSNTTTTSYSTQGMWERSYFDDDSLFGESSEEEESDEEDEDELEDQEQDEETKSSAESTNITEEVKEEEEIVTTGADDVDDLLSALFIEEVATQKKSLTELPNNNPLQLAHEHAEMAQDKARKTWAVTKLLPIDDFNSWIPNPAMTHPFTLDDFQQQAVARLERSESIFVAAHTSAGKTVCAEYAIALCKQHCTRCVYTSPIKALSNQKFRDFCQKFGAENVGLVTGDMQINVNDSTVLIMTTEILRSMLYRGADLIRDIEWVVFDEVHYVNDSERGVVWEEVIIMLPQYVNMIFLSATTPNTIEFSDWIGRTKRKPVHVIRTSYRPVPLSHFLWAGLKLNKIMEGKSGFLDMGHKEATKALKPTKEAKGEKPKRSTGTGSKQLAWQQSGNKANWMSLIRYLEREGLTPTVVFSFSKKKCEEIANMLRSLDLNTAVERSAVKGFTIQTVARLSPNDAQLPQVLTVCEMVTRGIGIHHGGLLPILKEMVEILFSKNLIKVLFATETFAMGVNMPARSVVFNSIRKHDGVQFRELEPGEYTQMAGRAGRRGLDKVGTVIVCCFGETPPPLPILRNMLTGSSTKLQSQFRLTYNMILNLLRVEDMSVEGMIKRSFSEFATQRALTANEYPKLLSKGEKTLAKLDVQFMEDADSRLGAEDLEEYFEVSSSLLTTNDELLSYVLKTTGGDGGNLFVPGRILLVTAARKHGYVRTPAMIIKGPDSQLKGGKGSEQQSPICLVLLPETYLPPEKGQEHKDVSSAKLSQKPGTINFIGEAKRRHYAIHKIDLNEIVLVSSSKHKIDPIAIIAEEPTTSIGHGLGDPFSNAMAFGRREDIGAFAGMKTRGKKNDDEDFSGKKSTKKANEGQVLEEVVAHLVEAERKERDGSLGVMDVRDCVKQGSDIMEYRQHCNKMEDLVATMRSFASHCHPAIEGHYAAFERKETLRQRIHTLRHLLSNESLQLFPDFLQRKAVLQTLGYVDDNETVCVKGRVACEVNTCPELIATEMVFEGVLNELEPAEIVAALSALVYQEKSGNDEFDSELPEQLLECCKRMQKIATNLGQLQKEHGLDIDPAEYCDGALKFGLVHVVYEWALGVSFKSICDLTDVQEGSIVRCITRLDELCREIRNCARVVGNPTLYRKMEAASMAIKRDIVFASSLYVS